MARRSQPVNATSWQRLFTRREVCDAPTGSIRGAELSTGIANVTLRGRAARRGEAVMRRTSQLRR